MKISDGQANQIEPGKPVWAAGNASRFSHSVLLPGHRRRSHLQHQTEIPEELEIYFKRAQHNRL